MGLPKLGGRSAAATVEASRDETWRSPRFGNAPEDAPEVVPGTAPQLVPETTLEHRKDPKAVYPAGGWSQAEKEVPGDDIPGTASKSWWKRRWVIPTIVACVVIVALAVGLGVGLTSKKSDPSNSGDSLGSDANGNNTTTGNNTGNADISCQGGLCQNILSLAIYEDDVFVIARTTNNRITIRPVSNTSWTDDFIDLGETPGTLISQPSSFSWRVNGTIPRLDVFAVSSPSFTVYRRHYSDAEDWAEWEEEGTDIGSSIATCGPYPGKMDVWSISESHQGIYHDWWFQKDDEDINESGSERGNTTEHGKMSEGENGWREEDDLGKARSAPAVVCRASAIEADLFWYDRDEDKLVHGAWDQSREQWLASQTFDGEFIGNPTVFSFGDEEWDFFGVQNDSEVYHLGWTSTDGGYSALQSIGGSIASTPTAVSLRAGTIDVIALGTNGTIQHIHFNGDDWDAEWEDLGVEAHSAPAAIVNDGHIYIVAVTEGGDLISLTRSTDDITDEWQGSLEQQTLGENLSLEYFTHES